jgi:hypothetical protein
VQLVSIIRNIAAPTETFRTIGLGIPSALMQYTNDRVQKSEISSSTWITKISSSTEWPNEIPLQRSKLHEPSTTEFTLSD